MVVWLAGGSQRQHASKTSAGHGKRIQASAPLSSDHYSLSSSQFVPTDSSLREDDSNPISSTLTDDSRQPTCTDASEEGQEVQDIVFEGEPVPVEVVELIQEMEVPDASPELSPSLLPEEGLVEQHGSEASRSETSPAVSHVGTSSPPDSLCGSEAVSDLGPTVTKHQKLLDWLRDNSETHYEILKQFVSGQASDEESKQKHMDLTSPDPWPKHGMDLVEIYKALAFLIAQRHRQPKDKTVSTAKLKYRTLNDTQSDESRYMDNIDETANWVAGPAAAFGT
jgi:hypothetical protein